MDKYFRVEVLKAMPDPQRIIYAALHQDYSSEFAYDEMGFGDPGGGCSVEIEEWEAGDRLVKNLLAGNRGHFGPLEHPQIVFNVGFFPHSTLQQVRTHRVGISFDCQSMRYTGQKIIEAAKKSYRADNWALVESIIEEVIYLRPAGEYTDRQGKRYKYTHEQRYDDLTEAQRLLERYRVRVEEQGFSEEHARGMLPFDYRQHWVMSCNVRSLMHLLDMRWPKNAQLECQQLCELIWPHFKAWVPSVAEWYEKNRINKVRLAP